MVPGRVTGWSIDLPALLPLAGFGLTLALGILVWGRRRNARLQRSFAVLNLAVACWNLDVFLLFSLADGGLAGRLDRLFQLPIIALPLLALAFVFVFLGRPRAGPLFAAFAAATAVLLALAAGPLYLAGHRRFWFGWYGVPGPAYPAFVALVAAYLVVSTWLLAREARTTREHLRRTQAHYLLLANLMLVLASLTNFLPLWGVPLLPLGNLASVAYVGVMAVTIVRHRLLDVRVLFRAGMLYSALTFCLSAMLFALVLGMQHWMRDAVFAGSALLPMLPAVAVGLAAAPLKASLQERLDRRFFRSRAEMRARLAAFPSALARLEREDEVWEAAWEQGWRHSHPEDALVLRCVDGIAFPSAGPAASRADVEAAGRLLFTLRGPSLLPPGGEHEVAVPVRGGEGVLGGCLLGPKASGELWSAEELGFVEAIAGQVGIAVERIRLREKVGREERLAALGRAAAVISHELRNPLNVIGAAVNVLRGQLDGRPVAPVLGCIEAEIGRGERFIRDVLSACREHRPHLVPIDLALLLRDFAASWPRPGGTVVEVAAPAGGLWIRGDGFQLRQVLENLARNAVEASGGACRVELAARGVPGDEVELVVADDGPGIPPPALPRLFEPFQTTRPRGTGLGLSIVKGIVEGHRGRIAASNRAVGAQLRIRLPAERPPDP